MLGKIVMTAGALAVISGGVGSFVAGFQSMIYALVPIGVLMLVVGLVQAVNRPD